MRINQSKIESQKCLQPFLKIGNVFEESFNGPSEFLPGSIESRVYDFLPKEFPQSFYQVQVWRIRWQEYLLYPCTSHPFFQLFVVVISCIIRNNMDTRSVWMFFKGSLVQFAGGLRIDALAIVGHDISDIISIQETVYIYTVTTAYGGLFKLFSFFYPGISGAAVVGGMQPSA